RRHAHARIDPGVDQGTDRPQALSGRGRPRLGQAPDVVIERRDREGDPDGRSSPGLRQDIDVADDHWATCDDPEWCSGLAEGDDRPPGESEPTLRRLVRVRGTANRDLLAPPRPASELEPQDT